MQKKYELTDDKIRIYGEDADLTYNFTLSRIRALHDIPMHNVKIGDFGGYIESESNLSHDGAAWVGGNAKVYSNAQVYGNAIIRDNAQVYGAALIGESAQIKGHSEIKYLAIIGASTIIDGYSVISNTIHKGDEYLHSPKSPALELQPPSLAVF